jgi:hypothetical protein
VTAVLATSLLTDVTAVFAAVVTPPDPYTMTIVWAVMSVCAMTFEALGIVNGCRGGRRGRALGVGFLVATLLAIFLGVSFVVWWWMMLLAWVFFLICTVGFFFLGVVIGRQTHHPAADAEKSA